MIKVGVIGLGAMGKNHARVYSDLPAVELVGVCDCEPELVRTIAEKYKAKAFTDYTELLQEKLDAISIAVPTSLHKQIAIAVASTGTNVLVEKPLADTVESAKEIINTCKQNKVRLMVGHIERFNPVVFAIKERIRNEEIISIDIARLGPLPPRVKDVGVVIDLAIHDIDIIRYITGSEFTNVYSMTSSTLSDNEDAATISLKTENGIICHITANWVTPFKVREISIATREGFIKGWLIDQRLCEYRKWQEDNSYVAKEIGVPQGEPLRFELQAFVNAIINNTEPPITGEDGLKALEIATQCLR